MPSTDLLNPETNEFLSANELYRRFQRVEAFNKKVITYCGGGAAASADAMALVMLGHTDVKLYDGSLLEWAADPDLPMEADPVPTSPDQALINIENSGLVTQLREALEWQTATTEILDIIIRSPGNVDPVFDAILEKVISLGDAAHCILWSSNGTDFRSAASRGLADQTSESRFIERTTGLLARLIRGDPLVARHRPTRNPWEGRRGYQSPHVPRSHSGQARDARARGEDGCDEARLRNAGADRFRRPRRLHRDRHGVHLAARLCATAKDGQILVSTRVADGVDAIAQLENLGNLDVKGLRRPVAAFNVGERISEASAHP